VDNVTYENTIGNDKYIVVLAKDTAVLLCAKSKQWIGNLKMNGLLKSAHFSADLNTLYSCGTDGEVYVWDVAQQKCIHRFIDSGAVRSTTVAVSANDRYIAVGSDSGVVNVYKQDGLFSTRQPEPAKAIMNLTTSVNLARFNHDTQLLGVSSGVLENHFRLVNLDFVFSASEKFPRY
jgi:U3 small nucleolar RNA-associated protein 18